MIIEFLGVSGSGKTTVATQIKDEIQREGKVVVWDTFEIYNNKKWLERNILKAKDVICFALFHVSWVRDYYRFLKINIGSYKALFIPLFNGVYLKLKLEKAYRDSFIHIFDEGALQYLWAVKLRGTAECGKNDLLSIEKLFGLPNVVCYVEASPETILARLNKRGKYTRIMSEDNVLAKIKTMQGLCENILSEVSAFSCTTVIKRIDNEIFCDNAQVNLCKDLSEVLVCPEKRNYF